jgi:hypothetical protein
MDALETVIASAETVLNNLSATQTEVDNATTALNNAVAAFDAAKRPGQVGSRQEENPGKVGVSITGLPSRFNDAPIGVALFEGISFENYIDSMVSMGTGLAQNGSATVELLDANRESWSKTGSWYVGFIIGEGNAVYISQGKQSFSSVFVGIPFSSFEEVKITGGLGNLIPGGYREGESGEGGPQPVTPAAAGLNVSAWKKLSALRVTP